MDAVITFVDGLDPQWQKQYAQAVGMETFLAKRYRDWGTLKYLLRGIETCMPFVHNVYLVVSGDSQVPEWANRDVLKVIRHADIIPGQFLPTFNSTAIEMFLHRIEGLDEQFVYFNDDMFPLLPCTPEDFFDKGRTTILFRRHIFATGLYKKQTRNSDALARKALGARRPIVFLRPQHICSPMLKSACEEVYDKVHDEIFASVSPLREARNLNQYLFLDYMHHSGRSIGGRCRLTNKHLSLAASSADKVCAFIDKPNRKFACINDVQMSDERFEATRKAILAAFEKRFPRKSRFEL